MAKNHYSFGTKIISVLLVLSIIPGCTRKIYVPVERNLRDTVIQAKVMTDTVLARDSIYVGSRGDTIIKETFKWRWRTKTRTDTVYKTKTDSIRTIVAAEAPHESQKREKLIAGSITWGTRLIMAVIALTLLLRHRKREI